MGKFDSVWHAIYEDEPDKATSLEIATRLMYAAITGSDKDIKTLPQKEMKMWQNKASKFADLLLPIIKQMRPGEPFVIEDKDTGFKLTLER